MIENKQYLHLEIREYYYYDTQMHFCLYSHQNEKVVEVEDGMFDSAATLLPFYSRETAIYSLKYIRDKLESKVYNLNKYFTNTELNDFIGCLENKTLDVWVNTLINSLWLCEHRFGAVERLKLLSNKDNVFSIFGGFQMLFKNPNDFQNLVVEAKKRTTLEGMKKELKALNKAAGILKRKIAKKEGK